MGEATKGSGKDYITSVVAGYEVYQRIAMSVQSSPEWMAKVKSWGLVSWQIYSAVIPAAKMLKLSKDKIAQSLGVAIYQTAIPMNKHANPPMGKSDVYHYAHGFNARDGIVSALIAQSGIDGMYDSLDGDDGYWAQVSDKVDWSWYEKGLGEDYLIMETLFKHWPANMWIQGPLDALDALVKENNIKTDDISEITLNPTTGMTMTYSPDGYAGSLDAQFSVPYCFAVYLIDPVPGPGWFADDKFKNPKVLEIASKVKGVGPVVTPFEQFYEFWEGSFPEITVEVSLKDGKKFSKTLRFPKGHPKNRMSRDEIKDRFRLQASVILKPDRVEKAIDAILNLENVTDMSEVGELMHN
jgi:2-methylcitrate dehydratase PrpD